MSDIEPFAGIGDLAVPDIQTLAVDTANQLHKIWDSVGGISYTSRKEILQKMLNQLPLVFSIKIKEEIQAKKKIESQIDEVLSNIRLVCEPMDLDVLSVIYPNQRLSLVEQSLQDQIPLKTQLENMQQRLKEVQEKFEKMKKDVSDRILLIQELCKSIGEEVNPNFVEYIYTDERITQLDTEIKRLQAEKESRVIQTDELIQELSSLLIILQMTPSDDLEKAIINHDTKSIIYSLETIQQLKNKINDYNTLQSCREQEINDIMDEISHLWEVLEVTEDEQIEFLNSNSGLGTDTIDNYKNECKRLNELKVTKLEELILARRNIIVELTNEMEMDIRDLCEKYPVINVPNEEFNEDVLEQHCKIIDVLKKRQERLTPLLKEIEKFEGLLKEREDYETLIADTTRYTSRKSVYNFKHEEKLRKRAQIELPKVFEQLKIDLQKWEETEGSFIYEGKDYLESIVEDERQREIAIKERKANRGKSVDNTKSSNNNSSALKPSNGRSMSALKRKPKLSNQTEKENMVKTSRK